MNLRRALVIAVGLLPLTAAPVVAQQQMQPWPGTAPVAPQQQQEPPCIADFGRLRADAETKAKAIQAASQRKATPAEACQLFNVFSAAEEKMVKYAVTNATWCGIPAQVIDGMKKSHVHTNDLRIKICKVAASPPRPAGPTLSDALTAPVTDANTVRTGRGGTFDTLTGSPLGSK